MYASTCIYSLLLILLSPKILFPTFECSHNCTNKANLTILEIMQIFGCYNNHIITRTHVLHFTQSRYGNRTSKTKDNYSLKQANYQLWRYTHPRSTTCTNKPTMEVYSHFTVPMKHFVQDMYIFDE